MLGCGKCWSYESTRSTLGDIEVEHRFVDLDRQNGRVLSNEMVNKQKEK